MKIKILKSNIVSFTPKTNSIHFNYYVGDLLIVRTDCLKDIGVTLDSKLRFHRHVEYLYYRSLKMLGLIRFIMYNFSSLGTGSLNVLYIALFCSKPEYASVAWYILTLADSNKLQNIPKNVRKFML
jgi:hypothetical protein